MSNLAKMFSKWDNRRLARVGDPVKYREAVQASLAAVGRFDATGAEHDLANFFNEATRAICRSGRKNDFSAFRPIYRAFVADHPSAALKTLLPQMMDRLYNQQERTVSNVWILKMAAAFEMERVRQVYGLLRMTTGAWWRARSKRNFAINWLRAENMRDNPVSTVYVETVRQVHQPAIGVPSYRGW